MYETAIDICNKALGQIKSRPIGGFLDATEEARQCKATYPTAVAEVLAMADWNFCKTKRRLRMIEHEWVDPGFITDPLMNFFEYPADAVKLVKVDLTHVPQPYKPKPHKHHKHHKHIVVSEDEYTEEMTDELDDDAIVIEEDDDDENTEHHHHHHKHHKVNPHYLPLEMPMLEPWPFRPMPVNDDGYKIQSVKLLHQHSFTPVIATHFTGVNVEYIRYEDNPQFWPPLFARVVVHYLAWQLATLLSGKSDSIQIQEQAFQTFFVKAQATNGNDRKKTLHQTPRLLRGCY